MPGPGPPSSVVSACQWLSVQPPQKVLITRSPTAKRRTPGPTATTVPAMSEPGVKGNSSAMPMPSRTMSRSR
ncbi:hypothetical protein D3C72_1547870 [compost metagenome]